MKWEEMSDKDKYQGCGILLFLLGLSIVCLALWGWIGLGGLIATYGLLAIITYSRDK